MSNLREALAGTQFASLESDPDHEVAIDRVHASAKADYLGVLLWKSKNGLEASALSNATRIMTAIYLTRYKREEPDFARRLVEQVVTEYIFNFCLTCRGTGKVMADELLAQCPSCEGSRIRNYTDADRCKMMDVSYPKIRHSAHKFAWVHNYLGSADKSVEYVLKEQLER